MATYTHQDPVYVDYKVYDIEGGADIYMQLRYHIAANAAERVQRIKEVVAKEVGAQSAFKYCLWRPEDYCYSDIWHLDARENLPDVAEQVPPAWFDPMFWEKARRMSHPEVYKKYKAQHDAASMAWERIKSVRDQACDLEKLVRNSIYVPSKSLSVFGRNLHEQNILNASAILLDSADIALEVYAEKIVAVKQAMGTYCQIMADGNKGDAR